MSETTYLLKVTEEQAQHISDACELVSRLHLGQLETLRFSLGCFHLDGEDPQEIDIQLQVLSRKLGLRPNEHGNAYYGISSKEVPDKSRDLFDIHQVIRHQLAFDRQPSGGIGTQYQKPYKTHAGPLATIKKEEGKGGE